MKDLAHELEGKWTFIYDIDGEYYYLGGYIFEKVGNDLSTLSLYKKYINDKSRYNFIKLIRRCNHYQTQLKPNYSNDYNQFMNNLSEQQINSLREQLNEFVQLFYKYNAKDELD